MELITLSLFCAVLLFCLTLNISIVYALAAGLVIFFVYGCKRGFAPLQVGQMCLDGIKTARNILITFLLIGVLTALWRASGTIATIIYYAAALIRPSIFLLMTFLLNCAVSVVTGTAFGTAATVGVICATMAATMQIPAIFVGGAILSGVFFGDRCSPVSTSALLVSELTKTSIFDNIRNMLKTAAIPFFITCALYLVIGLRTPHNESTLDLALIFAREFRFHWVALLPAILILGLSALRINVKKAMLASILSAIPICLVLQKTPVLSLAQFSVFGYVAQDAAVSQMLNGGGVVSMLKVAAIVCISSAYSGIFQKTGMLNRIQQALLRLSAHITPYGAMLFTSILASAIACNQTLSIMLTHQLCQETEKDKQLLALNLEDTAVVVAALIPWSIAGAVPLASANAPTTSLLFAFFLYLLPLYRLGVALFCKARGITDLGVVKKAQKPST